MNSGANNDPAQAALNQGVALINQGDRIGGEAKLQEAARMGHPFAAGVIAEMRLVDKVVSLAQAGQRTLALAWLDKASQTDPKPSAQTLDQLRKFVEPFKEGHFVQPRDKNGWNNMGTTLTDAGKFTEAVICFVKATELDSHYEFAWLNLGLALAKMKNYEKALVAFDRLLAIIPDSANGWHLKGMVLGNLQKQEEALICYDRALQLNPQMAEAWFNKSLALSHLKEYADSLRCCERVLQLNPRHLDAWMSKARVLYHLGRYEEVSMCHKEMNRIDPAATAALLKAQAARPSKP